MKSRKIQTKICQLSTKVLDIIRSISSNDELKYSENGRNMLKNSKIFQYSLEIVKLLKVENQSLNSIARNELIQQEVDFSIDTIHLLDSFTSDNIEDISSAPESSLCFGENMKALIDCGFFDELTDLSIAGTPIGVFAFSLGLIHKLLSNLPKLEYGMMLLADEAVWNAILKLLKRFLDSQTPFIPPQSTLPPDLEAQAIQAVHIKSLSLLHLLWSSYFPYNPALLEELVDEHLFEKLISYPLPFLSTPEKEVAKKAIKLLDSQLLATLLLPHELSDRMNDVLIPILPPQLLDSLSHTTTCVSLSHLPLPSSTTNGSWALFLSSLLSPSSLDLESSPSSSSGSDSSVEEEEEEEFARREMTRLDLYKDLSAYVAQLRLLRRIIAIISIPSTCIFGRETSSISLFSSMFQMLGAFFSIDLIPLITSKNNMREIPFQKHLFTHILLLTDIKPPLLQKSPPTIQFFESYLSHLFSSSSSIESLVLKMGGVCPIISSLVLQFFSLLLEYIPLVPTYHEIFKSIFFPLLLSQEDVQLSSSNVSSRPPEITFNLSFQHLFSTSEGCQSSLQYHLHNLLPTILLESCSHHQSLEIMMNIPSFYSPSLQSSLLCDGKLKNQFSELGDLSLRIINLFQRYLDLDLTSQLLLLSLLIETIKNILLMKYFDLSLFFMTQVNDCWLNHIHPHLSLSLYDEESLSHVRNILRKADCSPTPALYKIPINPSLPFLLPFIIFQEGVSSSLSLIHLFKEHPESVNETIHQPRLEATLIEEDEEKEEKVVMDIIENDGDFDQELGHVQESLLAILSSHLSKNRNIETK